MAKRRPQKGAKKVAKKPARRARGPGRACAVFCPEPMGNVPPKVTRALKGSFIVAVDGGAAHVRKLKLKPGLWVGDGDSSKLSDIEQLTCPRMKLPHSKDYTDLEYALHATGAAFLEGVWQKELVLLGAQGGRLDHELGTMLAVKSWLEDLAHAVGPRRCPTVACFGPRGMWLATMDQTHFRLGRGEIFSVFSPGWAPEITIKGAKYNLRGRSLDHATMGLSNEGLGREVTVRVHQTDDPTEAVAIFVLLPSGL